MDNSSIALFIMPDQTILFRQVNPPLKFDIIATEDGEVLSFKNAVLVRAETNMNRDEISEDGIKELAESIVGRPIDVEHDTGKNCGVFSSARPIDGSRALSVDGFIWADRYPNEAQGVQSGSHGLSVEASADNALCSVCGTLFASADDYCEHLRYRDISGAIRRLKGLHGKGGAVTTHPAGTNTRFEPTQIRFVASHDESRVQASWYDKYLKEKGETLKDLPDGDFADPEGRRFPYKIHGDVKEEGWRAAWSAANGGHTGKKDQGAIDKLRRDKPKGVDIKESQEAIMAEKDKKETPEEEKKETPEEEGKENEAKENLGAQACDTPVKADGPSNEGVSPDDRGLDDDTVEQGSMKVMSESMAAMQAQLTEMKASVDKLSETVHKLKASRKLEKRHAKVQAFMPAEEWEEQKSAIAGMKKEAFNLFAASLQQSRKPKLSVMSGVRLPDNPVAGGTGSKEPLSLTKS